MLRNYLKTAARHLWHQKGYTALNVGGLAVGMATCLLIGLYIQDELSYDDFHPQADQIQLMMVGDSSAQKTSTPYPLGRVLARELPAVKRVTRTFHKVRERPVLCEVDGRRFKRPQQILKADSSFFRVFAGFPLHRGARADMLDAPGEAVITESMAQSVFGETDPLGQTVTIGEDSGQQYTVVGVTEVPSNSTVQFDMALAWNSVSASRQTSWRDFVTRTYAQVKQGVSSKELSTSATRASPIEEASDDYFVSAMPLPDLYLSDEYETDTFRGQVRYLYIFGTIALLVLLIAMINYMNLVTAQAQQRAREVGVRKAMGASWEQVARQFLTETLLLSGLALIVAIVFVSGSIPLFNALFDTGLSPARARDGWTLISGVGVAVTVTLLGGAYPALILSGFRPTSILRGTSSTVTSSGGWLRKGLVVLQFAVSAGLVLGTTVIYQQLNYVQTKDLGFEEEQVVTAGLNDLDESQRELVRWRARRDPAVQAASVGSLAPGGKALMAFPRTPKDLSPQAQASSKDNLLLRPIKVDTSYVEALRLNVLAGQSFASSLPADGNRRYILNQAAVAAMGWGAEEAIGKPLRLTQDSGQPQGTVIGVVENFHLASLHSPVAPVVLTLDLEVSLPESKLVTRLAPNKSEAGVDHLRDVMKGVAPQAQFNYTFLDEKFDAMYRSERRLARIFATFAIIAVIVACMGLFGLVSYTAQRRTQEIGLRKALGASMADIVGLLSKEYAVLIVGALTVGLPAAYLWIQRWLDGFAYRVDVGVGTFVLTAGLVLTVAGITAGYHAVRAARVDPAQTLRNE